MKKYLWILCALLFATLAVACSDDDEAPSNVSVVTLSDTQITLVRGERYTLTARVETLDGKGCDITWATSDGRVVTWMPKATSRPTSTTSSSSSPKRASR